MTAHLIDLEQLPTTPWKNGGGSTRQLAIAPPDAGLDDSAWRISCARVASTGPFSLFPGIQRSLALLEGNLLLQRANGETRMQACGEALDFSGEEVIDATPLDGAVLDLNLMSRRDDWQQSLHHLHLHGERLLNEEAEVRLLLCNAGALLVRLDSGREFALRPRQALLLRDEPSDLTLRARNACLYLGLLRRLS
ncbi:HutD family protein [Pseudomonas sp. GOM6]|uniref:HutD/Ves family protein n=1 Tax=Pseudomonas sp. GOM6 TaxID=3036944 RepID=UPI002409CE27|nr:HutD family protein [Pseudomonas sp. GOM6]MDG1581610.1 HutD family protein [Pseudomonas sp. GOM6]